MIARFAFKMAKLTLPKLEHRLFAATDISRGKIAPDDYRDLIFGMIILKHSDLFDEDRERFIAQEQEKCWGNVRAKIQSVIDLLEPLDSVRCEIIATEAWRSLNESGASSDVAIVDEVRLRSQKTKRVIPCERWLKALDLMPMKGLLLAKSGGIA